MGLLKLAIAALSLPQMGLSLPLYDGRSAGQDERLEAGVQKRDIVTVTDIVFPTPTRRPEEVGYADANGMPVETKTEMVVIIPAATTASAARGDFPVRPPPEATSSSSSSDSSVVELPDVDVGDLLPGNMPTAVAPPPLVGQKRAHGITYSPYKGNGNCKSAGEVEADFAIFAKDYGTVRIYGVDCNQVATAYKAAKKHGNKLFIGIYDIKDIGAAVSSISNGIGGDWEIVDTVSVGNELVDSGQASVGDSVGAVRKARSLLRAAGYDGPVVIVDTFAAMLAHPELCANSDYCAANIHPFFDPNTDARQAGPFVSRTVGEIRRKFPGKRVVVTETGWPWKGKTNGRARPGHSEQSSALSSIRAAYQAEPHNLIMFNAFNDLWKTAEARTFMTEQYWGMHGRFSPADR